MEKFLRDKQNLFFWLISVILVAAILLFLYYSLSFLLAKTGEVFSGDLIKEDEIVRFKLNQVRRVGGLPGDR